jgi:hypothetical protein
MNSNPHANTAFAVALPDVMPRACRFANKMYLLLCRVPPQAAGEDSLMRLSDVDL